MNPVEAVPTPVEETPLAPVLEVRVRDHGPGHPDGLDRVVEVLKFGVVIGQLPATRVSYEMGIGGFSKLTLDLLVKTGEFEAGA